ncbi:hypothetical protein VP01_1756g2 [Puccinia sorghi]|uniref:Uncharacterized protein n=1 Tax=Puccinia sorghi TaxID=27349 RepID=A0A0L6VGU1_9BASI|nr:hypothetical protein VP01_1756g2 [Puccinia sorghi]
MIMKCGHVIAPAPIRYLNQRRGVGSPQPSMDHRCRPLLYLICCDIMYCVPRVKFPYAQERLPAPGFRGRSILNQRFISTRLSTNRRKRCSTVPSRISITSIFPTPQTLVVKSRSAFTQSCSYYLSCTFLPLFSDCHTPVFSGWRFFCRSSYFLDKLILVKFSFILNSLSITCILLSLILNQFSSQLQLQVYVIMRDSLNVNLQQQHHNWREKWKDEMKFETMQPKIFTAVFSTERKLSKYQCGSCSPLILDRCAIFSKQSILFCRAYTVCDPLRAEIGECSRGGNESDGPDLSFLPLLTQSPTLFLTRTFFCPPGEWAQTLSYTGTRNPLGESVQLPPQGWGVLFPGRSRTCMLGEKGGEEVNDICLVGVILLSEPRLCSLGGDSSLTRKCSGRTPLYDLVSVTSCPGSGIHPDCFFARRYQISGDRGRVAEEEFSRSVDLHVSAPSREHLDKHMLNSWPWITDSNVPLMLRVATLLLPLLNGMTQDPTNRIILTESTRARCIHSLCVTLSHRLVLRSSNCCAGQFSCCYLLSIPPYMLRPCCRAAAGSAHGFDAYKACLWPPHAPPLLPSTILFLTSKILPSPTSPRPPPPPPPSPPPPPVPRSSPCFRLAQVLLSSWSIAMEEQRLLEMLASRVEFSRDSEHRRVAHERARAIREAANARRQAAAASLAANAAADPAGTDASQPASAAHSGPVEARLSPGQVSAIRRRYAANAMRRAAAANRAANPTGTPASQPQPSATRPLPNRVLANRTSRARRTRASRIFLATTRRALLIPTRRRCKRRIRSIRRKRA